MRKLLSALILILLLCLTLTACNDNPSTPGKTEEPTGSTTTVTPGTTADPVVPHTHVETPIPATEPTCTQTGLTEGVQCLECGEILKAQESVAALGHTEVVDAAVAPTCTEAGKTEGKHCSVCNTVTVAQETVAALGHTEVTDAGIPATCTTAGKTDGKHCSVCNTVTVAQETVAALGHTEVVDVAVPATCTKDGKTEGKHCSVCQTVLVKQETVVATGHTSVTDAAVAATCTEAGKTEGAHCSSCQAILVEQETVAALGHDPVEHAAKDATCTEKGWHAYQTCSRCDHSTYVEISPTEHELTEHAAKDPTCTETGWDAYVTCKNCSHSTYVEKAALGHTAVVLPAKEATCTETGLTEGSYCSVCKATVVKQEEIAALGHTIAALPAKAATCTETGLTEGKHCSVCKIITVAQETTDPLGHTAVVDVAVPATCTKDGKTEGKHCSVCDTILVKQEVIKAPGHTSVIDKAVAPTCLSAGKTEGSHCSVCNEIIVKQEEIQALGHDLVNHAAKAPTCTEKGWDAYVTCKNEGCAHTTYVEKPALEHDLKAHAAKAPTCEADGWDAYVTCERDGCDHTTINIKPKLGHELTQYAAKDPTCTEKGWNAYVVCSREGCGHSTFSEKAPLGHVTVTDEAKAPTCTETGLTEGSHCSRCDTVFVKQTEVPANGHTEVIDAAKAPTCTETGLTEGSHCSVCDDILVAQQIVKALGHTVEIDVAIPVTCVSDGKTQGEHCSVCREVLLAQEVIPATGHDLQNHDAKAPTCTEKGWDAYVTCKNEGCAHTTYVEKPALGHIRVTDPAVPATCTETGLTEGEHCSECRYVFVEQTVEEALGHDTVSYAAKIPSCTEIGWDAYETCNRCAHNTYVELPATGHTPVTDPAVDATCTEDGSTEGSHCSTCDHIFTPVTVIPATGHHEAIDAAVPATCTTPGKTEGKHCSVCGHVIVAQEVVPATGHTEVIDVAVSPTCTTPGKTEGKHCSVCGHVIVAQEVVPATGHTAVVDPAVPATCQATGLTEGSHCSVCQAVIVAREETAIIAHTEVDDAAVAPTCTEVGYTAGKHCSVCGTITLEQTEIPAKGHTEDDIPAVAATCTDEGKTAGVKCSDCGHVITAPTNTPAKGHTWDNGVETVPPTCIAVGTKTFTCTVCEEAGNTYTEEIPVTGHTYGSAVTVDPTCVAQGYDRHECTQCDHYYDDNYTATVAHTWVNTDDVRNNGSCVPARACSVCHATEAAVQHNYKAEVISNADCINAEQTRYTCQNGTCGHTYTAETAPAHGHDFAGVTAGERAKEGTTCTFIETKVCNHCERTIDIKEFDRHNYLARETKAPTCHEAGEMTYTCQNSECTSSYTDAIDANPEAHVWNNGTKEGNVTTYTCTVHGCNGEKKAVDHSSEKEATVNASDLTSSGGKVQLDGAEFGLDESTLNQVGGQNVTMGAGILNPTDRQNAINQLDDDKKAQLGNSEIYNFTMTGADNKAITNFNGMVTVTIPYTLENGEDAESISIWYLNGEGGITLIEDTTYSNGYVTFETDHFSYYTVTRLTPAERCEKFGHAWDEAIVIDATCTRDGYTLTICKRCGMSERTAIVPAYGHSYTSDTVAATCSTVGTKTFTCQNCDHRYVETLPALGHTWGEASVVDATCTAVGSETSTCATCGKVNTKTLPKLGHNYGTGVVTPATCVAQGFTTYTCRNENCGHTYQADFTAQTGHNWSDPVWTWNAEHTTCTASFTCGNNACTLERNAVVSKASVTATCQTAASVTYQATVILNGRVYTDTVKVTGEKADHTYSTAWSKDETNHYHVCTVCGSHQEDIAHAYNITIVKQAASCTEDGSKELICTCGAKKTEIIPATGHAFTKVEVKEASCTENGYRKTFCAHCGTIDENIIIPALEHIWSAPVITVTPSCGVAGEQVKTCERCGEEEKTPVEALTHNWSEITVAPTCDAEGSRKNICSNCGEEQLLEVLPATGHKYTAVVTDKAPTCTEEGSRTHTCAVCGDTMTEAIPALGHSWGEAFLAVGAGCETDGEMHSVCATCGDVVVTDTIPATGHKYTTSVIDQMPTCTEDGQKTHTCAVCGGTSVEALLATGHNYGDSYLAVEPTCEKEGEMHKICANCRDTVVTGTVPAKGHSFTIVAVDKEATCTENGQKTHFCAICDAKKIEVIPAIGHNYVDGYCSNCGEYRGNCDHAPSTQMIIDLSLYGACGGTITVESCACGQVKNLLDVNVECEHIEDQRIDSSKEYGYTCYEMIGDCSVCKLHIEALFIRKTEGCSVISTSTYTFKMGDTVILENATSTDVEESHNMVEKVIDLKEYGACGSAIIPVYMCEDCGRVELTDQLIDIGHFNCSFKEGIPEITLVDGIPHSVITLTCEHCGLKLQQENWTEKDPQYPDCLSTEYMVIRIFLPDGSLFAEKTMPSYRNRHQFGETTYIPNGDSCEDGYTVNRTCTVCGYMSSHEEKGHDLMKEHMELREFGTCGGYVVYEKCMRCDYVGHVEYNLRCPYSVQNGVKTDPETGAVIARSTRMTCPECDTVIMDEYWDEVVNECTSLTYHKITVTVRGMHVLSMEYQNKKEEHQYTYEYDLHGQTCDQGYTVTATCSHCGEVVCYGGTGHIATEEHMDMGANGGCVGSHATVHRCQICGIVTDVSLSADGCLFDIITTEHSDDSGRTHTVVTSTCTVCKLESVSDTYTAVDEKNPCFVYTYTDITVTYKGESLGETHLAYGEENHQFVYTSSTGNCMGDHEIYVTCTRCDYSRNEFCSGHYVEQCLNIPLEDKGACEDSFVEIGKCALCGETAYVGVGFGKCPDQMFDKGEIFDESGNYIGFYETVTCNTCGLHYTMERIDDVSESNCVSYSQITYRVTLQGEVLYDVIVKENYRENHKLEYSYKLNGATCDEGYVCIGTCHRCGTVTTEEGKGHIEFHDSVRMGACKAIISGFRCKICNTFSDVSIMWGSCTVRTEESSYEENGIVHHVNTSYCTVCGLSETYEYYDVFSDENPCTFWRYETGTITYGEEIFSNVTKEYSVINHDLTTTYEVIDGNCKNGVMVHEFCSMCDYNREFMHHGHWVDTMEFDRTACNSFLRVEYCSACKEVLKAEIVWMGCATMHEHNETVDADNTRHITDIYFCPTCGLKYVEEYTLRPISDNCRFDRTRVYTFYLGEEVLYTYSKNDTIDEHKYDITYEFKEGGNCKDGYIVREICSVCQHEISREEWGHMYTDGNIHLSEYGCCPNTYLEVRDCCVVCGEASYVWLHYEGSCYVDTVYSVETVDGITHNITVRTCRNCSLVYTVDTWNIPSEKSECMAKRYSRHTVTVDGQDVLSFVRNQGIQENHQYNYTYELLGKTCEDGYRKIGDCVNCGIHFENVYYGHTHTTDAVEVMQPVCEGTVLYADRCIACGKTFSFILEGNGCTLTENTETVDENGVSHERHTVSCSICGISVITDRWTQYIDGNSCERDEYTRVVVTVGESEVARTTSVVHHKDHDLHKEYELLGTTCDDGCLTVEVCSKCSYRNVIKQETWHYTELVETVELGKHGACGAYADIYRCSRCGYQSLGFNQGKCDMTYSDESYTDDATGIHHNVNVQTCSACGLVYKEESWTVTEGCYDVEYRRCSIFMGETEIRSILTAEKYPWHHEFEFTYEMLGNSCDDGYIRKGHCVKCNTIAEEVQGHGHAYEHSRLETEGCGSFYEMNQCTVCGHVEYVNFVWNGCNFLRNEQTVYDEEGRPHTVITDYCSNCNWKTVSDTLRIPAEDHSCGKNVTYCLTIYHNGEEQLAYKNDYLEFTHAWNTTYEFHGNGCNDGYTVHQKCTVCGDENASEQRGHINIEERIDISLQGTCGGEIYVQCCEVCNSVNRVEVYGCRLVKTEYTHYIDENGNAHTVNNQYCERCGLITYTEDSWRAPNADGDPCRGNSYVRFTVCYNGNQVFQGTRYTVNVSAHSYEYTFTPMGSTCEEGYTRTGHCVVCGMEAPQNHFTGHAEKMIGVDLASHGVCEGTVLYARQCQICGEMLSYELASNGCSFGEEMHTEEEDGLHIYVQACADCGFTVTRRVHRVQTGQYACDHDEYTHTLYSVGDIEVGSFETVVSHDTHNMAYRYDLQGEDCEKHGYYRILYCKDCSYEANEGHFVGHVTESVQLDISANGVCNGAVLHANRCVICGKDVSYWLNSAGCSFGEEVHTTDENGHDIYTKTCSVCGFTETREVWRVPAGEFACEYYEHVLTIYSVDSGELCRSEDSRYQYTHEFIRYMEHDGISCNDGFREVEACTKCAYRYVVNQGAHHHYSETEGETFTVGCGELRIYHQTCDVCGFQAVRYDIPCGTEYTDASHFDEAEIWHNVYEYNCFACGFRYTSDNWTITENCIRTGYNKLTFYMNGEELYSFTAEDQFSEHIYQYHNELLGSTCEDGYVNVGVCTCGDTVRGEVSYNHNWTNKYIYFNQHGACGFYVHVNSCDTCHQVSSVGQGYEGCSSSYDSFEELDDNNYAHRIETWTCNTCGLVFKSDRVSIPVEGVGCTDRVLNTYTVTIGGTEYFSAVTESVDIYHKYIRTPLNMEGKTCDDPYVIQITCENCDYYELQDCIGHYMLGSNIDLNQLGLCGGHLNVDQCIICGYTSYFNLSIHCHPTASSSESYTDDNGWTHTVTTKSCESCHMSYTTDSWWQPTEDGSSCLYDKMVIKTLSKDGEMLYTCTMQEQWRVDKHQYVYTSTLNEGQTCNDYHEVTRTCTVCGAESIIFNGEGHCLVEHITDAAQLGACSGSYTVYSCAICSYVDRLDWYLHECIFSYSHRTETDGNGLTHSIVTNTCSNCGFFYETDEWTEIVGCRQYRHILYRIGKDGNAVEEYEIVNDSIFHTYTYTGIFQEGQSCADLHNVQVGCKYCDYSEMRYDLTDHIMEYVRESLPSGENGTCGGIWEANYCAVCGYANHAYADQFCGTDTRTSYVDDNGIEHDVRISYCDICCWEIKVDSWTVTDPANSCHTITFERYTVTIDGEVRYDVTRSWENYTHNYTHVAYLEEGQTCEDPHMVIATCRDCGEVQEHPWYQGHLFEGFTYDSSVEVNGTCSGHISADLCTVCGYAGYISWYGHCGNYVNSEYLGSDGYEHHVDTYDCKECGKVAVRDSYIVPRNDGSCFYDEYVSYTVTVNGNVIFQGHTVHVGENHQYVYRSDLPVGGECTMLHNVYISCANPSCFYERMETTEGHFVHQPTVYVDEHGGCEGGYVYYTHCYVCDQRFDVDYYLPHCNMVFVINSDTEQKLVCSNCGLTIHTTWYHIIETACKTKRYYTRTVTIGDEQLMLVEWTENIDTHSYTGYGVLDNEAAGCDGGVTVYYQCQVCFHSYNRHYYNHAAVQEEIIDLGTMGSTCGGYAMVSSCTCGRQWVTLENGKCELAERYADPWTERRGTYDQFIIYTCTLTDPACGFVIRKHTYSVFEEGSCFAVTHEDWEFGYNAQTDTAIYSVSVNTGIRNTHHNYVQSESFNTTEGDYRVSGYKNECTVCGDSHEYRFYYLTAEDGNEFEAKRIETIVHPADYAEYYGFIKRITTSEYSYIPEEGCNRISAEMSQTFYADGSEHWYNTEYTYEGCTRYNHITDSNGMDRVETQEHWDNIYGIFQEPTCTQSGKNGGICRICGSELSEVTEMAPYDHNWILDDDGSSCSRCGLHNQNGASGNVVLEDMTEEGSDTITVGYWEQIEDEYVHNLTLILSDGSEVILENVALSESEIHRALCFSREAVIAEATDKGYEAGTYEVRLSFTPVNNGGTSDYAITIPVTTAVA